jgi:hypothetical protein
VKSHQAVPHKIDRFTRAQEKGQKGEVTPALALSVAGKLSPPLRKRGNNLTGLAPQLLLQSCNTRRHEVHVFLPSTRSRTDRHQRRRRNGRLRLRCRPAHCSSTQTCTIKTSRIIMSRRGLLIVPKRRLLTLWTQRGAVTGRPSLSMWRKQAERPLRVSNFIPPVVSEKSLIRGRQIVWQCPNTSLGRHYARDRLANYGSGRAATP